jgi:hypothetical protein
MQHITMAEFERAKVRAQERPATQWSEKEISIQNTHNALLAEHSVGEHGWKKDLPDMTTI